MPLFRPANQIMATKTIKQVLEEHRSRLLNLPNVTGLAQGGSPGAPHINIYVRSATPETLQQLPGSLEGFPVRVIETGPLQAI
jgi:hypothetical protein